MNDTELFQLLKQAKEQSPKPSRQLAVGTVQAYRERFARPSFLRRHWRLATAAGIIAVAGVLVTRPSTGSPLPPEYDRPNIIGSGSMGSGGWSMDYYTVLRPSRSDVTFAAFEGGTVSNPPPGQPVVFHRFLGDGAAKVYFGYDVVVQGDGKMSFRPLSVEPADMPEQFRATGSRILSVQELPAKTYGSGQNVAVTLLVHPDTGQQLIDYITVSQSFVQAMHHIIGNMIMAFHSHFAPHGPATAPRELHPIQ
jgi:hypothetical protein